jgi:hypothetical protein
VGLDNDISFVDLKASSKDRVDEEAEEHTDQAFAEKRKASDQEKLQSWTSKLEETYHPLCNLPPVL